MTIFTVSTTAAFQSALGEAHAGDSILLAPGNYSGISISNLNVSGSGVTIGSQNAENPAVLTGLQVSGSTGLNFTGLDVVGTGPSNGYASVSNSSNVSFSNMLFEGTDAIAVNDGGGLSVQNSTGISVTNSIFEQLGTMAIAVGSDNGVTITGNEFFDLGEDGIDSAGTSNITISRNSFTDFVWTPAEHPDAIQFWTAGTTGSAHNITISDNIITRGPGMTTQGIFMQDNGGTQPYLNLTISGNTLIGIPYNAIYVDGSVGADISANTIQTYTDYTASLYVADSTNPTVTNNAAPQFGYQNNTGLVQSGNTVTAAITQPSPSLSNIGAAATYTAGGAPINIAHAIAVADLGSTILESARVAITGGFLAGDALNFANQSGISGSYNAATGVLTLTGNAPLAAYQAALESVTFSSSASDPTHGGTDLVRDISFSVNDGAQASSTLAATVNLVQSAPPSLSNTGAAATYAAGGAAADIAHALGVTDPGSTTLASAQVAITGGFLAGDALNFANQSGISGSYNAATGVLTLSGTASLAAYQSALESITYSSSALDPSKGGSDLARAISYSVNDGAQSSSTLAATVNVTQPAPPSLSNTGAAVTYQAGGAGADIAHALSVTDPGSTTLASAQVAITGGFLAGDALNFANQSGISGSYNAATGVLTLSGTASLAAYQSALESITYSSSALDPSKGGSDLARAISYSVNDGAQSSSTLAATVNVTQPAPPSLSNVGDPNYQVGGAPVDIAQQLAVADTGSSTLASARVAITGGFLAGDALNFANQSGISGSYNAATGVLTLTGNAPLAAYQAALESVTFSSSASDPTHGGTDLVRDISFSVNDGAQASSTLAATVNLVQSAPPSLSNTGAAATYAAGGAAADIAHALGVTDPGSTTLASAQVAITGGFLAGDALNFANQSGISGSYNAATGVLTLSGTASLAAYQSALESITYSSSALDPSKGGSDLARAISYSVNDGAQSSSTLAATVNVTQPAPPSLSNTGAAVTYQAGGAGADIAHALSVTDPGSTTLASAQVAITGGFLAGDALNFANQSGISGSYNAATGVLTLSGTASLAAYQSALESITYSSSAQDPTFAPSGRTHAGGADFARTISFSVSDGARTSSALNEHVDLLLRTGTSLLRDPPTAQTPVSTQSATPAFANSGLATTAVISGAGHIFQGNQPEPAATSDLPSGVEANAFIYPPTAGAVLAGRPTAWPAGTTPLSLPPVNPFGLHGALSASGSHTDGGDFTDLAHQSDFVTSLLGAHDFNHSHVSLV